MDCDETVSGESRISVRVTVKNEHGKFVTECEKEEGKKSSLPGIWLEWMLESFAEMRNVGEGSEGR